VATAAVAQDEPSPLSGAATSWVGTPPPADCTIEAPSVDAVVAPLTTAYAVEESTFPLTVPTEADLPDGEPANEEQVEAASATLWEAVACLNGGEFGKFFALLSAEGMRSFYFGITVLLGGEPATPTAQQLADLRTNLTTSLAAPPTVVAEAEQARIDAIRDARILPDGRLVCVIDGTLGVDASLYMVFSLHGDRWLIDAFGQIGTFDTEFME
jgi:hypothetical protein